MSDGSIIIKHESLADGEVIIHGEYKSESTISWGHQFFEWGWQNLGVDELKIE
jgi:hypothetical protein